MSAAPARVELVKYPAAEVLAVVHYHDGTAVTVRRRGRTPDRHRWNCSTHGHNTDCGHAIAAELTCQAHDALADLAGHTDPPADAGTTEGETP